ncbi:TonB-dependent receptor [Pedobacter insulae]|uniref:Iron complex outermembrane recepter protein n=1 Tax=Pedobacter insulae TaxID=414048 RepID=A0A1I2Y506_9SPHI|nr:TonB-dependent receptor [Pedobacter insulae]SFH20429.1 iron complex outermembrane recepter protein [Pedobacter insulae]
MILKSSLTFLFSLSLFGCFAQSNADTVKKLNEITVKGYYNRQPLLRAVSAVSLIDSAQFNNQNSASFVGLANSIAGVRMEERSPGSYRFSIRGSLLRSPFGVRNIKVYVDDFPLTDAGGNTYLNLLDVKSVAAMEVYKGPEASIFGANTGGAVLINTTALDKNTIELGAFLGSYGLFKQHASITHTYKNYRFNLIQGYQKSDGYRVNSALKRNFIQTTQLWDYAPKAQLKALLFMSDLSYQTPGGLTGAQLLQDPKMARPATPTLPGAVTQKAAIYNQTIFGGLSHSYAFNANLKHVIAIFGSSTDFKNPFITNYEERYEYNLGSRTFLDLSFNRTNLRVSTQVGLEAASSGSEINNFNNNSGSAGLLQAKDDLTANQTFAFLKLDLDLHQRLLIELGASLNFYNYRYQSYFPTALARKQEKFTNQLMPKIALSYLINSILSVRSTVSKGYSPPTIAEVRSSDNVINTNLQAEYGWNYELGLRLKTSDNRIYVNVNAFSYHLKDAIVRRLNENDTEYFINAGGTKQKGLEIEASGWLVPHRKAHFLTSLQLRNNYTYSHFRFQNFTNANNNYNGHKLTGVPAHTVANSAEFTFNKGFFLFAQHNYVAAIPLNDANTAEAKAYHLTELKAGLRNLVLGKVEAELFSGVNNLFNATYSLGNDLNAVGSRYFNPAAKVNYYFGFLLKF